MAKATGPQAVWRSASILWRLAGKPVHRLWAALWKKAGSSAFQPADLGRRHVHPVRARKCRACSEPEVLHIALSTRVRGRTRSVMN